MEAELVTTTVIANGVLVNGDDHLCVLVNGEYHPSNSMHLRMHFLNDEIHPLNGVHLHMHFLNDKIHPLNGVHLRMHFLNEEIHPLNSLSD